MTKTLGILVLATLLVASVATGEKMAGSISLAKRVFMLFDVNGPLGTGFRICRPNLVLTAAHVINEHSPAEVRVVSTYFSPAKIFTPTRIERHPKADVAALFLDEEEAAQAALECFDLGVPSSDYPGFSDYPLAEDVLAYGFPVIADEKPIPPRMMKGHIQSKRQYEGYAAYELAFPAFPGLSGSPVFRDHNRNVVVAIVTTSTTYAHRETRMRPRADWALGAALPPLAEWLGSFKGS